MKYRIITIIASLIFCISGFADDSSTGNQPDINVRGNGKNKGGRNIMSPVPECYIVDGKIRVVSRDDWSYATVVVSEIKTGTVSMGAGYLDEGIEVYLPASNGHFTITITTESGDEFVGAFDI